MFKEFVYHLLAFISQLIVSICLLITLVNRNQADDGFPPEPGFKGKLTSSVCKFYPYLINQLAKFL